MAHQSLRTALVVLAGLVLASSALAADPQPPAMGSPWGHAGMGGPGMGMGMWDGGGGHGMELWKELNLTPEQQQSVQALKESYRPLWQEMRTRGTAIREKLTAASPDDSDYAAATQSASQETATLAADMVTLMAQMRAELHAILTPEQRAQLKQQMQEQRQRWDTWRSRRARPTS